MRVKLFDEWHKEGFEPKAVARAANRILAEAAWGKGVTAGLLMLTLCERLGCDANEQAQFRLIVVIQGLYAGVRDALKPIKVEA